MPIRTFQPSFAGGVFAPSLHSRTDLQRYAIGLKTAKNFIIHRHGGASNRPGTEYIAEVKDSAKKVRLIPFEYSTEQAYVLEFGDHYVRFYKEQAAITKTTGITAWSGATAYFVNDYVTHSAKTWRCIKNGTNQDPDTATSYWVEQTIYEIYSPFGEDDLAELKFTQSADVLFIVHPDYSPRELRRYGHDDWELSNYAYANGPFQVSNVDTTNKLMLAVLWAAASTYAIGDYVVSEGTLFRALQSSTNYPPIENGTLQNITYWQAIDALGHGDVKIGKVDSTYRLVSKLDTFDADMVGALFRLRVQRPGQTLAVTFTGVTYWKEFSAIIGAQIVVPPSTWSGAVNYQVGDTVQKSGRYYTCQTANINKDPATAAYTSTIDAVGYCKEGSVWRIITHGTWNGKIAVSKSIDNGLSWQTIRDFSSQNDNNYNTFGNIDEECLIKVTCLDYASGTINVDLSIDPYELEGIVSIASYVNTKMVTVTAITDCPIASYITDWAEGSWSDYRGWPFAIAFYQERLVFGGTYSEPQTIWMTKSGNYYDFGRSTPLIDSDGISVNLPSHKVNGINNLITLGKIFVLTQSSEWSVGNSDSPVTPTSVSIKNEGYRGSSIVDPVIIGNRLLYVQPMGSTVRDVGYEITSDGYAGEDISVMSSHLFEGKSVKEMAYQQEPESIVWVVMDDGSLLSLTYMREQEMLAWTHHETDGEYESICTIPGDRYNEIWFVVKRGNKRFVEILKERSTSTNPRDQFFVDCGLSYDNSIDITGATKANPVVITSALHGLSDGDHIFISDVLGMTELNNKWYQVGSSAQNSFSLLNINDASNINGTAYTTYVSGGYIREAVTGLSGLDHLEGETVAILADGSVQAATVSSGAITLSPEAAIIHVGLPYTSDLETLPINIQTQEGSSMGRKLKVSGVTVSFLNSRFGAIGPNEDNLDDIPSTPSISLDDPIPLFTGFKTPVLSSGYDRDGSIYYRQENPLPVTILAFIPSVSLGGTNGRD